METCKSKQKVLLCSSRGITSRQRHLFNDLQALLPHTKKDSKIDSKQPLHTLNEIADINNCNNALYFEIKRHSDVFLWASKTPNGPSAKFHVQNIHTMDELKMTGNCLKGSRHIVSFDKKFDSQPHYQLVKELLTQIFAVPKLHRRSKPFIDHVITFTLLDNRIWFRNYQIVEKDAHQDISLVEIGPRLVLNPIRVFSGSFGGKTLHLNPNFVPPSTLRRMLKSQKASKYVQRCEEDFMKVQRREQDVLPDDEREEIFKC